MMLTINFDLIWSISHSFILAFSVLSASTLLARFIPMHIRIRSSVRSLPLTCDVVPRKLLTTHTGWSILRHRGNNWERYNYLIVILTGTSCDAGASTPPSHLCFSVVECECKSYHTLSLIDTQLHRKASRSPELSFECGRPIMWLMQHGPCSIISIESLRWIILESVLQIGIGLYYWQ